jgi:two-component system, sensor histidine kinase FlrB
MHTDFQARSEALANAFQVFNEVSLQLAVSYQELQQRVELLSRELAGSRSERMRQLAEKEKLAERLSKLLEALPAGVVLLDGEQRVRELNPVARDLLGAVRPGESWAAVAARVFLAGAHGGERPLADGRTVILTERTLDQAPGRILVLQDVTEARRLQQRLERQERLGAMGEMAAKLAHQVRTPLSSALLYVGHLGRDDLGREQRQKFAARLRDRLQHMERQVNDILAFSRGQTERHETLALSALIEDTLAAAQPQAEVAQARLTFSDRSGGDLCVRGNADALMGAFSNLITNALQHGGRGVHLHVDLGLATDGQVTLLFRDDGPGVPADVRGQVFDPFFTTRSDGTGLGLAVVQSVVLAHRGRVRLEEGDTGGGCFVIELPAAPMGSACERMIA